MGAELSHPAALLLRISSEEIQIWLRANPSPNKHVESRHLGKILLWTTPAALDLGGARQRACDWGLVLDLPCRLGVTQTVLRAVKLPAIVPPSRNLDNAGA